MPRQNLTIMIILLSIFAAGVFDGRHVHFSPFLNPIQPHGQVLRYDAGQPEPTPAVSEWGLVAIAILVLTMGTVVLRKVSSEGGTRAMEEMEQSQLWGVGVGGTSAPKVTRSSCRRSGNAV